MSLAATVFATVFAVGVASGAARLDALPRPVAASHTRAVDASGGTRFGLRWRRATVRTGLDRKVAVSFGQPAISTRHGLVVVGTGEGRVLAYDLHTGASAWQVEHKIPFEASAATVTLPQGGGEAVVLGTRAGTMLAVRAQTGVQIWEAQVGGGVRALPVQVGDHLLLATENNQLVSVALASGEVTWREGRPPPAGLTVMGQAMPAVDRARGRAYAAFSDGHVVAFGLADGRILWDRLLSMQHAAFVDVDAGPVLAGNRVFAASYSEGVFALDPHEGATIWSIPAASVTSLAVAGDLLLAGSSDGIVLGLSQSDGAVVFRTQVPAGPASQMVVRDGLAALTVGDAGLVVLDARTGEPLQATAFGGRVGGAPTWVGDDLAVLSDSGYLVALRRGRPGIVR